MLESSQFLYLFVVNSVLVFVIRHLNHHHISNIDAEWLAGVQVHGCMKQLKETGITFEAVIGLKWHNSRNQGGLFGPVESNSICLGRCDQEYSSMQLEY